MTDLIKGVLSRVLSEELAHQENWKKDDASKHHAGVIDRDSIMEEIRTYMKENDIPFRDDFYYKEMR